MDQRREWIAAYRQTANAAEVCRRFGISPPTLRKWYRRWQAEGDAGLIDRSRAPLHSPGRKVHAHEAALIHALQDAGLGLRRIRNALAAQHGVALSTRTIRRALRPAPAPRAGILANLPADDSLAASIAGEIVHGRLPPGTKLAEERLGQRFGAGRTRIREALKLLEAAGLVESQRYRGAFVAAPSREDIAQAYAARRLIEAELMRTLAGRLTRTQRSALREHIAAQQSAAQWGQRARLVRLLTEFHVVLARMAENRVLAGFVETLAAKTSLATLLYDQTDAPACGIHDHARLLGLLEAGKGDAAAALIVEHLAGNHERQLPLVQRSKAPSDFTNASMRAAGGAA